MCIIPKLLTGIRGVLRERYLADQAAEQFGTMPEHFEGLVDSGWVQLIASGERKVYARRVFVSELTIQQGEGRHA
jgi:hypothetical protein